MRILVCFLLLLIVFVNTEINDIYSDIEDGWVYSKITNFQPPYNLLGKWNNDWDIVPTVPFEVDIVENFKEPTNQTIRDYLNNYFDPDFMSINEPDVMNFRFKLPQEIYSKPNEGCLYPSITHITQNNSILDQIDHKKIVLFLKRLFLCQINYYWMDYGLYQYPRYVLQGFCQDKKRELTAKMCRACETRDYRVMRFMCLFKKKCGWKYMKQKLLIWCTQFY
ncbi:hypothetical protein HZS_7122 [Henneguya salminicola]|nr:hypothetical protein HZS_7122 [Henneguya salminicola]